MCATHVVRLGLDNYAGRGCGSRVELEPRVQPPQISLQTPSVVIEISTLGVHVSSARASPEISSDNFPK